MYLYHALPSWVPDASLSSPQLLLAAGALLFAAGLLLGLRRTQRVSLQRSLLTDELVIYLSRIADALERQAAAPSMAQIITEIEKRIPEPPAPAKLNTQAHSIPYSMFGREYPKEK